MPTAEPGLVKNSCAARVGIFEAPDGRSVVNNFGQAEIENLGVAALGDENVRWLDVAVDDALFVRGLERVGDFDGEIERGIHGEWPAGDEVLERLALHEFHGDEQTIPFLGNFVNCADVGVVQCGSCARFAAKAFERLRIFREIVGEEFEGDGAAEVYVFGFVHDAHTPATEFFHDAVMRDGLAGERGRIGHLGVILG